MLGRVKVKGIRGSREKRVTRGGHCEEQPECIGTERHVASDKE